MKKSLALLAIVGVAVFAAWFYSKHPLQTTVTIRDTTFIVDVAVTGREKEVGLGGRKMLPADRGMLFVYDHKERYPFWMRSMRFPIDIIWIADTTVVDITKDVPLSDKPVQELPIYHPTVPVDKVLEINAGLSDAYRIAIGDSVKIKN